jgi:septal ring factor EnvC (AmiA/AmiB activator)
LEEDNKLRQLRKVYEDLVKSREDQEEKLESVRSNTKELMEKRRQSEMEITKQQEDIDKMHKMIKDSREKTLVKEA